MGQGDQEFADHFDPFADYCVRPSLPLGLKVTLRWAPGETWRVSKVTKRRPKTSNIVTKVVEMVNMFDHLAPQAHDTTIL